MTFLLAYCNFVFFSRGLKFPFWRPDETQGECCISQVVLRLIREGKADTSQRTKEHIILLAGTGSNSYLLLDSARLIILKVLVLQSKGSKVNPLALGTKEGNGQQKGRRRRKTNSVSCVGFYSVSLSLCPHNDGYLCPLVMCCLVTRMIYIRALE